jgi:hypothetical protein
MSSHRPAIAVMVALLGIGLGCSRGASNGGSNEPSRWSLTKPAKNFSNWQMKCDGLCDVKAKAASLDALCTQVAAAAKATIGVSKCEARKSIGYPAIPASAVSDAAIVELTPALGAHHAFLAVKGASGWQIARSLGAGAFKALEASPVDIPGLEPAAVQVRVALSDTSGTSERLVVCGLAGDGTPMCPVAVEVAGSKSAFAQMGAGLAQGLDSGEWRADVALTPKGFVAKPVSGTLPEGLAGEHSFDVR